MTDNLAYNHDPEKEDDTQKRRYYILPIPMALLVVEFSREYRKFERFFYETSTVVK